MYIEKTVDATFLLRFDNYNKLLNDFNNKNLNFSCPANWLNFAVKTHLKVNSISKNINMYNYDNNVGDIFECAFEKVNTADINFNSYVDHFGKPMGENLVLLNLSNGKSLLYYQPHLLMPTFCFYSINGKKLFSQNPQPIYSDFQVIDYSKYFFGESNIENKGVLIIHNVNAFWDDLSKNIKSAIKSYPARLTDKNFYSYNNSIHNFNFLASNVEYCSFYFDDTFKIQTDTLEDMFCKCNIYSPQSEVRVIIPNISFKNKFQDSNIFNYNYEKNILPVHLPKLHAYAKVYRINELPQLPIFNNGLLNLRYWKNKK